MLTTLTFAFLLRRRDGVTLGLTSHDRPLLVDGVDCRASPGMTPSAIQRSTRLDADTADLAGALSHEAIGADDLDLGRWTGAALTLHAVDWETGATVATLIRGTLGAVERAGARFSVALDGPLARLDEPLCERTSPECRARLGDRRCRVDPARITAVRTVVAADETGLVLAEGDEERSAAAARAGGAGARPAAAGVRQDAGHVRGEVRQRGELPGRTTPAGQRPAAEKPEVKSSPERKGGARRRASDGGVGCDGSAQSYGAAPEEPLHHAVGASRSPSPFRGGTECATRARALIGARFRPHGRDPATGLDCVGLAGLAMGVAVPTGYALRGGSADAVAALVDATGLIRCEAGPGTLALVESGPAQCHLLILTDTGFVHADAGRRRMVERRGAPPWPLLGCWRA